MLVGIIRAGPAGDEVEQFFGVVEAAVPDKGVLLGLRGIRDGEQFWLPPDLGSLHVAKPGSYRLRSTGEVVVDPDYTTTWTIHPPKS